MPGAPVFLPAIRSRQRRYHKVNMARGAESNLACGWLLLATCVRGAQSEKSCLGGAGAFLLGGDTPFSLERKWGSHKWGVPLTPPKELSHWKKCPSYQVSRIATFEIWDWGAADPIRVGAHTSLVANWVHRTPRGAKWGRACLPRPSEVLTRM